MTGRHRKEKAPDKVVCRICRRVVPGWKNPLVGGGPLADDHPCVEIPPLGHMLDAASMAIEDRRNRKKG